MSQKTKQVVLTTTTRTAGQVVASRFVTFTGKQATANEAVLGVSAYDAAAGDLLGVEVIGITLVESGGAVTVGAKVASDAQGCAVAGESKTAGVALSAAEGAGTLIRVLLMKG